MRVAWFTPADGRADAADTRLLVGALASRHEIDLIDERGAHDFVWRHARAPYDLCVYELDNTPAHQFIWPYLGHYPGVTRLRRLTLQTSRAQILEREQRFDDFAREFAFAHPGATPPIVRGSRLIAPGPWPMLAVPLFASRLTVVAHAANAKTLAADYPGARVRALTPGVEPLSGARDEIVIDAEWPVDGAPLVRALSGFAAGRAVVVFDCPETADWPSLNPHDWQPRCAEAPVCVAIDPRDEVHSLRRAVRRLEKDGPLRARLGAAAESWWRTHATVEHAAAGFEQVLGDALTCGTPARPAGWPSHVSGDGLARVREVLGQFGIDPPF